MNSKDTIENRHKFVDFYKMTQGCTCGYDELPYNLCFDHLEGEEKSEHVKNGYSKRSSAGGMFRLYSKSHSIKELIAEIKKCRILCHHCHNKYTHHKNKRSIDNIEIRINTIEELEEILYKVENGYW
jgi:hypothetical protein